MSDEKFLCHRSVHDDISKRAYKEGAKAERENPCTENGCTDIGNCDEICQHSRIYSPVQMQQAIARARVDVIYEILKDLKFSCPGGDLTPICDLCGANKYCIELRLAQPEPTEREPE